MAGSIIASRRYLGSVAVDGFFNGMARVARLHPQASPARHAVEHLRDVRYFDESDMREHLLDVWRPLPLEGRAPSPFRRYESAPWPILFYVHGGGFRILSKVTHWVMGVAFARRGFLGLNVI